MLSSLLYTKFDLHKVISVAEIHARIAALVKEKLKKSDDQTNINKYRVTVHIILQNIMSEQIFKYLSKNQHA